MEFDRFCRLKRRLYLYAAQTQGGRTIDGDDFEGRALSSRDLFGVEGLKVREIGKLSEITRDSNAVFLGAGFVALSVVYLLQALDCDCLVAAGAYASG